MRSRAFHGWLCYRTTVPLVLVSLFCAFSFITLLFPHFLLHTTYTSARSFPPLPSFGSSPVTASPTFHSPYALISYFFLLHPLHGREHDYCIGNCLLRSPQLLAFLFPLFLLFAPPPLYTSVPTSFSGCSFSSTCLSSRLRRGLPFGDFSAHLQLLLPLLASLSSHFPLTPFTLFNSSLRSCHPYSLVYRYPA